MNEGQKKFQEFIMNAVKEERKEEAGKLLEESFAKQADGSFNMMYLASFVPKMMDMIKPDQLENVRSVMENFRKGMKQER